ncbi:Fic/DOC family N-terminal domain-containing protein [Natronoglycomyces albus]|uniref:Fic/DOC N-terminal domain-containing protein n=1 Tax=Natronoglycomyces albus TaxID=2811108 RepID=A0A895XKT3_9ACTN|nr:Fic/DOC family N-terminal domain-containing protein [Natronoglycomyces albus]QSB05934.1 hypothetical protein JQS30_03135 [Natronoglycomyces albus]
MLPPLPAAPAVGFPAIDAPTRAAMAVARLDMAASGLPNPALLARPTIRREAVSTWAIEGTYATYDETLESDFIAEQKLSSAVREVKKLHCRR